MNYLVLGSSGQVGAALAELICKKGHTVLKFDLQNDDLQDLRKEHALDNVMQVADFVFFLAFTNALFE